MKRVSVFFISILIITQLFGQNSNALNFSKSISIDNIKKDLILLSSSNMEGRETGEVGQKLAAQYIYKEFYKAKLLNYKLNIDSIDYFQHFDIFKNISPSANIKSQNKIFEHYEDFMLSGFSDYYNPNLELVFLGTAPDSLYLNKNYSEKAILFLTKNLYAGAVKANDIIKETGCKVIFFCNPLDPHQMQQIVKRQKRAFSRRIKLDPDIFSSKNPFDSITKPKAFSMYKTVTSTFQGPIEARTISELFDIKLKDLRKCAAEKPYKIPQTKTKKIELKFNEQFIQKSTENVLACIPGTEKKDEFIVISAHYDHIGKKGEKIFYGANDNASGTAAMLEIARKIKEAVDSGIQLKRSIVFAAFSGEEKGLLGSKFFVESKTLPIEKIKANLNIDMLGRKDKAHSHTSFIYLLGANDLNPKLKRVSDSLNQIYPKIELDYSKDTPDNFLYAASDQASFIRRNVPAIFYFNGLHNDYHKSTDTADKIDYEAIKKVSGLIFLTTLELANME